MFITSPTILFSSEVMNTEKKLGHVMWSATETPHYLVDEVSILLQLKKRAFSVAVK